MNINISTKAKNDFMKELLTGKMLSQAYYSREGTQFIIARKWNSWYPSFFKVDGGCYMILPETTEEKKVIVIDPGFRFLEIIRKLHKVEPNDIDSIIVSHLHPDHLSGLIEFCTLANVAKRNCKIYLNTSSFEALRFLSSSYVELIEIKVNMQFQISINRKYNGNFEKIYLKAIDAYHREIGNRHNSLSFIFEIVTCDQNEKVFNSFRVGILGDTDGNSEYLDKYVNSLYRCDIIILHLGSFSGESGENLGYKHLYFSGSKKLLGALKDRIGQTDNKKLIVISEFGLELGTVKDIVKIIQPYLESYAWRLPLIHYLKKRAIIEDDEVEDSQIYVADIYSKLSAQYAVGIRQQLFTNKNFLAESASALILRNLMIIGNRPEIWNYFEECATKITKDMDHEESVAGIQTLDYTLIKKTINLDDVPVVNYLEQINKYSHDFIKDLCNNVPEFAEGIVDTAQEKMVFGIGQVQEYLLTLLADAIEMVFFTRVFEYVKNYCKSIGLDIDSLLGQAMYPKSGAIVATLLTLNYSMENAVKYLKEIGTHQPIIQGNDNEDTILKISNMLQESNEDWCKIIIGDLNTCFLFKTPIKIKLHNMEWGDPLMAKVFYEPAESRFVYKKIEST